VATTGVTVAVTGPTGTFGFGLLPLLEEDERVSRVVGVARRPFDPAEHGWTKMEYRQGDVQSTEALEQAFEGMDVVVHLAFLIVGGKPETTRSVNVEGTLNAFRAAAAAGAKRFVYASSVAAYGFHRDNPVGMDEDWPVRPADRLFYAQEKAELERLLQAEAAEHPELDLYLLRPPIVLGPHAVGAKVELSEQVKAILRFGWRGVRALPMPVPDLPLQLIHEDDVGQALLQCVVAAGPPGAYNIAADDVLTLRQVARELGVVAFPVPAAPVRLGARLVAHLPLLPQKAQWVEALSQPAIMDTSRARSELRWTPRFTALESLQASLG
jgi:nucleoside-diphosphate-sugar epimerase